MIEVQGLTKYFGPFPAIQDISFSVNKGEIVGFLGPNGAGKSTTMRILTCFFPPTSGSAKVAGYDVLKHPLEVKRKIGYFPEKVPLYPDTGVSTYLNFVAKAKGMQRGERKRKVGEVMENCGIDHVSHRLIGKLSKGYRQRVCLAQALLNDPEVLILDEPTIGLDPEQVVEARKLIQSLGEERTVLLSTHILQEVSMTCGKIIIIDKGKIIAVDTPENLTKQLQQSKQIFVRIEGPQESILKELRNIPHVIKVEEKEGTLPELSGYMIESKDEKDISQEVTAAVYRNNWILREIRQTTMRIEDIFIKLVTEEEKV